MRLLSTRNPTYLLAAVYPLFALIPAFPQLSLLLVQSQFFFLQAEIIITYDYDYYRPSSYPNQLAQDDLH